jgi:uncharacterized protein (TIGR03382 family)
MTMDPVFAFNGDLDDVSNFHTADRVIDCAGGRDPCCSGTPWTVTLPGGTVRGTEPGVWPVAIESQPAALKILQYATEGQGDLLEDNTEMIGEALAQLAGGSSNAGSGGKGSTDAGRGGRGGTGGGGAGGATSDPDDVGAGDAGLDGRSGSGDGGCSASGNPRIGGLWAVLPALALLLRRRRRG